MGVGGSSADMHQLATSELAEIITNLENKEFERCSSQAYHVASVFNQTGFDDGVLTFVVLETIFNHLDFANDENLNIDGYVQDLIQNRLKPRLLDLQKAYKGHNADDVLFALKKIARLSSEAKMVVFAAPHKSSTE